VGNKTEHYSADKWQKYVAGGLDKTQERAMEQHLSQCDKCLELYASAAEKMVCQQVSSQFTEGVMAKIASLEKPHSVSIVPQVAGQLPGKADQKSQSKSTAVLVRTNPPTAAKVAKSHNQRQSFGNYAIAACLTLLLTAGGIFGGVASAVTDTKGMEISITDKAVQKVGFGWSEVIAEKTLSIFDIVKPD